LNYNNPFTLLSSQDKQAVILNAINMGRKMNLAPGKKQPDVEKMLFEFSPETAYAKPEYNFLTAL